MFLRRRAVLASAVAIPVAAISAVVLRDDDDDDPRMPCEGCREWHFPEQLTRGEAGTYWCEGCVEDSPASFVPYDFVEEDDEP
jgi:hypothetical protein